MVPILPNSPFQRRQIASAYQLLVMVLYIHHVRVAPEGCDIQTALLEGYEDKHTVDLQRASPQMRGSAGLSDTLGTRGDFSFKLSRILGIYVLGDRFLR